MVVCYEVEVLTLVMEVGAGVAIDLPGLLHVTTLLVYK